MFLLCCLCFAWYKLGLDICYSFSNFRFALGLLPYSRISSGSLGQLKLKINTLIKIKGCFCYSTQLSIPCLVLFLEWDLSNSYTHRPSHLETWQFLTSPQPGHFRQSVVHELKSLLDKHRSPYTIAPLNNCYQVGITFMSFSLLSAKWLTVRFSITFTV